MAKNILIHGLVDQAKLEQVAALTQGQMVVLETAVEETDWTVADDIAADINVLFTTHPPRNIDALTALEFIQIGSVGYTQLIGLDLAARGVRVSNARGVFDVPIAEWNVAMMVNLVRDLRGMIRNQERGLWDPDSRFQQEINGATVGLWGYGGIGRETARLCRALGLTVHVLTRRPLGPRAEIFRLEGTGDPDGRWPQRVFTPAQTQEFLAGLDFLILAMPLTEANRGIVGAAELAALPAHAYVLNPARGPLIEAAALLAALRTGTIAGAALDTHYHYPMPPDHPLWQMPNVIMTPHISGSLHNRNYATRLWTIFHDNVRRLLAGKPLLNALSAAELQGAG